MAGYARSQGLVVNNFYGWHARLKQSQVIGVEPVADLFHQVEIKPDAPIQVSGAGSLRFLLPNGIDREFQSADFAGCCHFLDKLIRLRP